MSTHLKFPWTHSSCHLLCVCFCNCKSLCSSEFYLIDQISTGVFASNCPSPRLFGARLPCKMIGCLICTLRHLFSKVYCVYLRVRAGRQWEAMSSSADNHPNPYLHIKTDKGCFCLLVSAACKLSILCHSDGWVLAFLMLVMVCWKKMKTPDGRSCLESNNEILLYIVLSSLQHWPI